MTRAVNSENKVGAVGFNTRLAPFLYPISLIRVDERTGDPIRDSNGMCLRCEPGQSTMNVFSTLILDVFNV